MSETMYLLCEVGEPDQFKFAGDQTGKEVRASSWYDGNWTTVYRFTDASVGGKLADAYQDMICNGNIGSADTSLAQTSPVGRKSYMRRLIANASDIDYDKWAGDSFNYSDGKWYSQGKILPEKWNPYAVKDGCTVSPMSALYTNLLMVTQIWYHKFSFKGKSVVVADRAMDSSLSIPETTDGTLDTFLSAFYNGGESEVVRSVYGGVSVRCDYQPYFEEVDVSDIYTLDADTAEALKDETIKVVHIRNSVDGAKSFTYSTTTAKFTGYTDTSGNSIYKTLYKYTIDKCMEVYTGSSNGEALVPRGGESAAIKSPKNLVRGDILVSDGGKVAVWC